MINIRGVIFRKTHILHNRVDCTHQCGIIDYETFMKDYELQ